MLTVVVLLCCVSAMLLVLSLLRAKSVTHILTIISCISGAIYVCAIAIASMLKMYFILDAICTVFILTHGMLIIYTVILRKKHA